MVKRFTDWYSGMVCWLVTRPVGWWHCSLVGDMACWLVTYTIWAMLFQLSYDGEMDCYYMTVLVGWLICWCKCHVIFKHNPLSLTIEYPALVSLPLCTPTWNASWTSPPSRHPKTSSASAPRWRPLPLPLWRRRRFRSRRSICKLLRRRVGRCWRWCAQRRSSPRKVFANGSWLEARQRPNPEQK